MQLLDQILTHNKNWAKKKQDAGGFLVKDQKPLCLWIGCSDSRVPTSIICGMDIGQIFVHRNMANLIAKNDHNCLAVIEYAVDILHVPYIIVCGHYDCKGIQLAMNSDNINTHNHLNIWIDNIKYIIGNCSDHEDAVKKNVLYQLDTLENLPVIQKARQCGHQLNLHGLIYDPSTGLLKPIDTSKRPATYY